MSRAPTRWLVAGVLAAVATMLVVIVVLSTAAAGNPSPLAALPLSANASADRALPVHISSSSRGPRIPRGYLGLSIEFQALRDYTGFNPRAVNPVLVQLIRNLSPGQAPTLRIGGDSTDASWVPASGVKAPAYRTYSLSPGWLATTAALARTLRAHMTMGINLAADEPALAQAQARAYLRTIGRARLSALEIGNEPNIYGKIAGLKIGPERFARTRSRSYDYARFAHEFGAMARVLPPVPLTGPALAIGPKPDPGTWEGSMGKLLRAQPRLRTLSVHRYPLRNCYVPPRSPQYPTVAHLLSHYATTTLAASLTRWIQIAHSHHRRLRVDEFNSVACRGKTAISDTFASSLWVINALFTLARAGVDGVNLHTLPDSAYELFHFQHGTNRWSADVRPIYYGLALFAQAAPAGAQLLSGSGLTSNGAVSVWATRASNGVQRAVLVNVSSSRSQTVSLRMPSGTSGTAHVTRLAASSVSARTGITWGGRGYGTATTTGKLSPPRTQTLTPHDRTYTLSVPHGSATLVTFPR